MEKTHILLIDKKGSWILAVSTKKRQNKKMMD